MERSGNLLPCAKIIKSFGIDGAILVKLLPDTLNKFDNKEPVFIIYEGLPVPFFINTIEYRGTNQAILHIEGIWNLSLAEEITGRELLTTAPPTSHKIGRELSPSRLIDIDVYDSEMNHIGKISSFYDYPNNPCIGVTKKDSAKEDKKGEILIPLHEDLIIEMNIKKNLLCIDIPKGLIVGV